MIEEDYKFYLSKLSEASSVPEGEIMSSKKQIISHYRYIIMATLWNRGYTFSDIGKVMQMHPAAVGVAKAWVNGINSCGDEHMIDVYRRFVLLCGYRGLKEEVRRICEKRMYSGVDDAVEEILNAFNHVSSRL